MDLRQIEERLITVLKNAEGSLPAEQMAEMQSLVSAGEPGVALENLWTQLEEYDVTVPNRTVSELRDLATMMGMKAPGWIERGGGVGSARADATTMTNLRRSRGITPLPK